MYYVLPKSGHSQTHAEQLCGASKQHGVLVFGHQCQVSEENIWQTFTFVPCILNWHIRMCLPTVLIRFFLQNKKCKLRETKCPPESRNKVKSTVVGCWAFVLALERIVDFRLLIESV